MALPKGLAGAMAGDMAKAGLAAAPPPDGETEADKPPMDAADPMDDILNKADELVPGLGDLLMQFADRIKSEDEASDEEQ